MGDQTKLDLERAQPIGKQAVAHVVQRRACYQAALAQEEFDRRIGADRQGRDGTGVRIHAAPCGVILA